VLPQLDALFGAFADPERVLERLSADPGLDAARLRTAARLARLVSAAPGPAESEIWRALRMPGELEEDVHVALWSAQVLARLAPDDDQSQMLLGAALYRTSRIEEAHAALERADELSGTRGSVGVLAFLSMARMRLGRPPRRADGLRRALPADADPQRPDAAREPIAACSRPRACCARAVTSGRLGRGHALRCALLAPSLGSPHRERERRPDRRESAASRPRAR
jgi:hypothetical protein